MNDFKFKVICYFQGYGKWVITVDEGDWNCNGGKAYTIMVDSGQCGGDQIHNKEYRFPIDSTVIEENK